MKTYTHPPMRSVSLPVVMQALSDPIRVRIIRRLIEAGDREFACNEFPMKVSKATRSHHFQILRDAGLIRTRVVGNKCMSSLRAEELEKRFPGLAAFLKDAPR